MRQIRRFSVLLVLALALVGCGDGGSRTETSAVETLGAALTGAAEASSYRIEVSTAQTISSSALGIETSTALDRERPGSVSEVTPDGFHGIVDLVSLLGPVAEGVGGPLEIEMWGSADRFVFDTTSYERLQALNPLGELGPYRPGVFSVDAGALGAMGNEEVVGALGGGTFDLASLAETLPAALRDVSADEERPGTYVGTASIAAVNTALGTDVEDMARATSAGMALNLDVDPEALAAVYVDFYESQDVEVVVTVEAGLLSTLEYEMDIAPLYEFLFADDRASALFGATPSEARAAREAVADTVWTQSLFTRFVADPDLVLPVAPEPTEDRTEEMVEFFEASGLFD
ncbi:MAG: hypothetical protein R2707_20755 [Acidimicrobiales bacterium]